MSHQSTAPKRPSRASIRRQRVAVLAVRAQGAGPLPKEFLQWLDRYAPTGAAKTHWATLRPFVQDVLQRTPMRGAVDLQKRTSDLAQFAAWLRVTGVPLDPSIAMVRPQVDEYCRTGMPESIRKSRSDRRGRLRRIADHVNPEAAPRRGQSIPREPLRAPYTPDEVAGILRAIMVQPTPTMVRQLCVCVGFGLGAGIDSSDLKLLFPRDVQTTPDGIRVSIAGRNPRTVWVRRELEGVVARGLQGADPRMPLIGFDTACHNVTSRIFDRVTWVGGLPKLDQNRLRTTWIAWLMQRPVPMSVICTAAGLKSTRTLFDLLKHIDTTTTTSADLRDGGAA
jgi:hypothetical protein